MESRNLEEQLDACATVRSLAELIDIILAEAAHPPVQTRASFGWPRLRDHILREIQPMVLIAAGRVARLQNVVESLPAGEGDPVERLVQLRQWCARSEQPAEAPRPEHAVVFSPDFHEATYRGELLTFNDTQARLMKLLAEGRPVDERTLGAEAKSYSDNYRLRDSFRSHGEYHRAWTLLIKQVDTGIYRLRAPVVSPNMSPRV